MDEMSTQQAQCIIYIAAYHATSIFASQVHPSIPGQQVHFQSWRTRTGSLLPLASRWHSGLAIAPESLDIEKGRPTKTAWKVIVKLTQLGLFASALFSRNFT